MKVLIALILLSISTFASAEYCTSVIKDQYSGYEYENFTRWSYSRDDACYQAISECRQALYDAQSRGRYYNANCVIVGGAPTPTPPPRQSLICKTDLVDVFGNTIRQFTAPGYNEYEACRQSDEFCKMELARGRNNSMRCINRGIINGRDPYPRPNPRPDIIFEECRVSRLDPAGRFVEGYLGRAQGPRGTDVKGAACREAINQCSRDLVGRQTCNFER